MFSLVFPGQGSQTIGMGKDFFESYDLVKDLFNVNKVKSVYNKISI